MLNFCTKMNDKNSAIFDGDELYFEILKIGKIINELGNNKDKDLTEWQHETKGTYKLNTTEINIIKSINNDDLELIIDKFIKKYNYLDFDINHTRYDIHTNKLLYNENIYAVPNRIKLKMFCHIVYLIYEITIRLNKEQNHKNNKDDIVIDLSTYYIDFYTKKYDVFKTKTIILLYNIINNCFYNGVNYFVNEQGDIIYFTQYLSSIAFFELYPVIKQLQNKGFKTACMKQCEVCQMLFYSTRKSQKYCGDKKCLNKKNVDYVVKFNSK